MVRFGLRRVVLKWRSSWMGKFLIDMPFRGTRKRFRIKRSGGVEGMGAQTT